MESLKTTYQDLPSRASWKVRGKAETCREYMNEIKQLTYQIIDYDALDAAANQLSQIVENLKYIAPKDHGLFLERSIKKKSKKNLKVASNKKIR